MGICVGKKNVASARIQSPSSNSNSKSNPNNHEEGDDQIARNQEGIIKADIGFSHRHAHVFEDVVPMANKEHLLLTDSAMSKLALTKPAPDFKGTAVVNGQFKDIQLSDYKGKYVVLFFYPLDFTFVCPTEIIAFSDRADEFRKIGCEVIGASTDSHFSHLAWINTPRKQGGLGSMNIPLLADKTGQIARDYGCYKEDEGIAFRGLYIIDDKGLLRQVTINDLPVGRSVDETIRLVQAFQYTDEHGEVCPANWKPGDKTMKPDPVGSKDYFASH